MDEAIQAFVHEVIALDYPADQAVARLDKALSILSKKSA
jgi:GntR family transcriptional regulator